MGPCRLLSLSAFFGIHWPGLSSGGAAGHPMFNWSKPKNHNGAKAAVARFELSADVLAFDTLFFDTHIATLTPGKLARRGHAKSKRSELRVEQGSACWPARRATYRLLYRTYSGNSSDQADFDRVSGWVAGVAPVAGRRGEDACKGAAGPLVRDGGFWSHSIWNWIWMLLATTG